MLLDEYFVSICFEGLSLAWGLTLHSALQHVDHISQGSVATHLMFVEILNYCFVGNLMPNLPVKECLNRLALGKVKGKSRVVLIFRTRCNYMKQCKIQTQLLYETEVIDRAVILPMSLSNL